MNIQSLDVDVLMFRGEAYESIATAFIDGGDVLLVDVLGSVADGQALRAHIEEVLGKRVRTVVLTHGFADHRAGLPLFADAAILAHPRCAETLAQDKQLTAPELEALLARLKPVADGEALTFGRHELRFFHNEGKSRCSIGIEVPSSDLLFTGDNLLGQIAYISGATPELIHRGIDRLEARPGAWLVEGHQGVFPRASIAGVRHYMHALEQRVREARRGGDIAAIRAEDCLAEGAVPTAFEREWHGNNLGLIASRGLFAEEAA